MRYCYDDTIYSPGNMRCDFRHLIYCTNQDRIIKPFYDYMLECEVYYIDNDAFSWLNDNFPNEWSYDRDMPYGITLLFRSKDAAMKFKLIWG